jgi:asparagine synthase (glutamine-hydrolysing)
MCGIAGQVSFSQPPDGEALDAMVVGLQHRGPDDRGVWKSPGGSCLLGHTRLSVIDISPLGHQPMLDRMTGNTIVFNGEIYNFQNLRRECENQGDTFVSRSDTEVLLALYRRRGVRFLDCLRGMFAIALWDEAKQQLIIARDRLGKKPLNYATTLDGIVFCSEIQPLRRHPAVDQDMDIEALDLYLQLQYIPAPWSIYRSIRKLPPAHYAVFDRTGFRIHRYWELAYTPKIRISESEALEALEDKIAEAVQLRMIADVPLGALLSGGVDSSLIVALMAKASGAPVKTYSIGFGEQSFSELPYAEEAARICGTDHHPETLDGNEVPPLSLVAMRYGEPFADSSALPSFRVCENARRHVTVAMNGDGGDELMGGYPRYALSRFQLAMARLAPEPPTSESMMALASWAARSTGLVGRVTRKAVVEYAWPHYRSAGMYSDFWPDEDRRQLLGGLMSRTVPVWRHDWIRDAQRRADNPVDRMLWHDLHTYLPGDLLAKMDIASMNSGLETRSPLLDHQVMEFCASLPADLKVRNGVGKYLLKKLAERYFPSRFVYRQKMGFGIPLESWLRGPLSDTLRETLTSPELMTPLNQSTVASTLNEFLAGRSEHASRLWCLLMFGVWRHQEGLR